MTRRSNSPSDDDVAFVVERAGKLPNGAIATALGVSRNVVAGIIYRLRREGDPRVPPAGTTPAATAIAERKAVADAFADGAVDLADAARRSGLALSTTARRWSEIRAKLGWQAQ